MNVDDELIDDNANGQEISGTSEYAYVNINDLRNSRYIYSNENNKDYATSITLRIPRNTQMTPIELKGVNTYKTNVSSDPAIILPFGTLEEASNGEVITLNPGDDALLLSPNQTEIAHVSNNAPPVNGQITSKRMRLFEGAKYYIYRAAELAEAVGHLSCAIYDAYNKITLGLPKWIIPAVLGSVTIQEENGVSVQDIDLTSDGSEQEFYTLLPRNSFRIMN